MKKYVTCLLLLIVLAQPANAEVILDQEFKLAAGSGTNYYHDYPGDFLAQTFTVRNTGELPGVGVQGAVSGRGQFIDDLHIRVTRVGEDEFALMDEVWAEATIRPTDLPIAPSVSPATITDVDLSSWHVPVTAGDRLAILFSSDHAYYSPRSASHYVWFFQIRNPHRGGEFSIYSPTLYGPTPLREIYLPVDDKTVDAGFCVYVDVIPEPDSMVRLSCDVAACCCRLTGRRLQLAAQWCRTAHSPQH